MTTEIAYRRAASADVAGAAACVRDAYADHGARIADFPDLGAGVAEDVAGLAHVAVDADGAIAGFLALTPMTDYLILANVAVRRGRAGKGIGRALMALAEREARDRGLAELRLATHVDLPENVRLYERLGWRETGREGAKVRMAKRLA